METSINLQAKIEIANQRFMEAFERGDASGLAALYTEGGQLLPTHSDTITGSSAIKAFWKGAMEMGLKKAKLETIELEGQGDTAMEVGKYTLLLEGGQVADSGKYIVIWKNEGGTWKLHRDIWNTSQAAQQA